MDLVFDRLLQTKDSFPQGIGDNEPYVPSIRDASKWTEAQKQEFVQYLQDKAQFQQDKVRFIRFQAATNNQQDSFKIIGQSKATFFGKAEL